MIHSFMFAFIDAQQFHEAQGLVALEILQIK